MSALASPASSISDFSVISHPHSPYDAAVLVEPGSDDDEIVFSPRSPGNQGLVPSGSGFDSDDDFILIASPRAAASTALTGLALTVVPAPSRIPNDEQLATPTQANNKAPVSAPSLPTPPSSGPPPNRLETSVACKVTDQQKPSPTASHSSSVSSGAATRRRARQRKAAKLRKAGASTSAASYPSPAPSPTRATGAKKPVAKATKVDQRGSAAKASIAADANLKSHKTQPFLARVARLEQLAADCEGIGARGVVVEDDDETTLYQAAVNYISSFLANPDEAGTPRLPLLQALIVELGLCNPTSPLPASVRAAKALLRADAHINVRDYIAARGKGVEALQQVMFQSRKELLKDLRKRRVPIKWIKDHGLSMFLIHFF
ncbi:hypothetical protein EXIGLDRAFT_104624 [Exidia glandulosa HHB12029]|uniref:Uncharacterized protein n=1 Tax=Exidia glandulosa HHB12029 TaxID=1314781 RepID=A0A166AEC0_EXIGL|nr:hypothetical protein EXIGLDRAFT_104624 [Exidia glandulosa HHB12029]